MKVSLSSKFFLAMLAVCAFAVLGMVFAAYLSLKYGFLGYLNQQAEERMERIVPRIEQAYAQNGSWDFIRRDQDQWFELLRPDDIKDDKTFDPSLLTVSDLTGAFVRFALLDEQRKPIIGYRAAAGDMLLRPINHQGHVVGWMALAPLQSVTSVGDRRFQLNQLRSSLLVGLACLLGTAVIAWWLSRALLRPIREVARATHELAAGDYAIQVPVRSQDEAGQLAGDFNRMATTLAGNERMRRDFMADISHELRTPLAVMRAELEAMEDGIRPLDATALRSLQGEVGALTKLVDDLFDLSLAEVGGPTYRRERIDLRVLLPVVAEAFQASFAERGLTLRVELPEQPLWVLGDESRLGQLLHNLLENSRRYTDSGGQTVLRALRDGERVLVQCEDSAPGVDAASLERLFERFYRAERSRNRASGGTGLGLAICRGIAEVHGGKLSARASALGGLLLTLELPVAGAEA
ncbi:ATP-binding protein [Pseudomonas sp. BGr12]|uniref:ATP-binding protein n=1 Tax=unclassified Pseudomonas TaxID=196821 RepID=UPI00177D77FE|nr:MULTISPECIES: ATP-binding protein [unclassified Pseudomonas]MBD9504998.1 HAMP domain-containing protein [Pseudomonas sp. PDM17]MBD9578349.1 HAMP domain-containing protein [Pseudomonas sp. PDM23]MBD9673548.1 HAMP domain-containing protein [Pseudomonas sp. PDM21]MDL2431330.1 ATP-binding protein [Pseudomonas sp. BJa5]